MQFLFKKLKAINSRKLGFSRIFITLLMTLPATTSVFLFPSQKTLAQTAACQSPYHEVYSSQSGNTIVSVHVPTGATIPLTTTGLTSAGTVNSLATSHVNHLVYYAEGTKVFAWDAINNQHITITSDIRTFNPAISQNPTVLSTGGAAFYNDSLYLGVDPPSAGVFEIYKVDFVPGSNGRQIQKVTPLNINGVGKANGQLNNGDWGDFIISDQGVIYGSSGGTAKYWSYDLNTSTFTDLVDNIPESSQLAKDGSGQLWAFRNGTSSVIEIQIVGNTIQTVGNANSTGTHSSADAAECVTGQASIGDRVWSDTNGDGVQDAGEVGIAGVTVAIYRDINKNGIIDATEPKLATQVTDTNGNYDFTGLLPHDRLTGIGHNDFIVKVESGVPASYTATTTTQKNADLSIATEDFNNADFGYKPPTYNISGSLFEDFDGGDDLDATEPKLPANITVKLLDSSNNVILTTTTDANGAYTFTGVTNGNYKIQVDTSDTDIPAGYTLGTPNDLAVTVSGSAVTNQNFGFDEPTTGNICISPSIATLPSTFNSSNYTKNTALQGSMPLSFYDGSMQVSASLSGTATWSNGVQIQTGNLGSFTGDYLYLQPTNASNYLASNNEATYVLSFPSGVPNFSMIGGGLNNNDGTTIIASYKGVPIQITAANFSKLSSGMTLKDADGDGQSDTVVSSSTTGGTNVDTNTYKLTIPVPVDKITVVSGKDESGNNSTVTIGLHTFQYCYEGGAVSGTLYEDSDRGNDLDASEPKLPKDITVTLYKDNNSNNTIDAGEEVANTLTNDQGQYTFKNVAAGTYKVKVDTTDTDIPSSYTLGTPNDLAVTVSGSAITGKDFGFDIPSNPNVLLVKRITKVNNSTTTKNGDNLAGYIDEATNLYDDNTLDNPVSPAKPDTNKWVDADNDTKPDLIGGINGGNVQPGDEIEYTIYYLSAGDTTANNVVICDRVPENATFIPTAFNNFATKNTTGLSGGDRGIVWQNNGATESLTNTSDGDTAEYLSPGIDATIKYPGINCNGSNTNGAVIVKLGNVPNATAPGTPINSYGFIRFRGRVK